MRNATLRCLDKKLKTVHVRGRSTDRGLKEGANVKDQRVAEVIRRWCGQRATRGSDGLRSFWETYGPSGVPFDDEGAERLIRELEREFPGHGLRPGTVLGLTVDGLIDAIPNSVVEPLVAFTLATRPVAAPAVVSLSEETIERLSKRIAQLLTSARTQGGASAIGRSSRAKTARKSAKGSAKGGRTKVR